MSRWPVLCLLVLALSLLSYLVVCAQTDSNPSGNTAKPSSTPPAEKHRYRLRLPFGIDSIPEKYRQDMDLPFGLGINYFWSREDYKFKSAQVSLNGQPIPPEMMTLDSITVTQRSYTVRGDAYLLPFLDVYGVGGWFRGSTSNIRAALQGQQIPIPQNIPFNGTDIGFGATLNGGYKSMFFCYDWNKTWAKVDLAAGHVPTVTQGPRLGYRLGRGKPTETALYIGGFKEQISGNETGSISFPGIGQFDYAVNVAPERAWNYVLGADIRVRKHLEINLEEGFGKRRQFLFAVTGRI